jgi:hypothetical protein
MMHVKFYAISILFLIAVGACFFLITFGQGPDEGIAADNVQSVQIEQSESMVKASEQQVTNNVAEDLQPDKAQHD